MSSVTEDSRQIANALEPLYMDLHRHPELAFAEARTAGIVRDRLRELGLEVTVDVGQTGVRGVLRNGDGPTVVLRADMDGLPVLEETGLDYASTDRVQNEDGTTVPLMHACGHDVHVACLLGAIQVLDGHRAEWSGTLVTVFQPAEEEGTGAKAMVADGVFDDLPVPVVVLGQHVAPVPVGLLGAHPGPAFASADSFDVRLFGRGGHGSRPETTIDPVLLAAAAVMRLQAVVSREVAATDMAVLTVGQLHAGTKNNIIADEAMLGISVRSSDNEVRATVIGAMHRIIRAEAEASGSDRLPEVTVRHSLPLLVNDPDATARTMTAFRAEFGETPVIDPGPVTGSEDVGVLSTALGVPIVYWIFGSGDPARFAAAAASGTVERDIPSNHSPHFAPVMRPTLETGVLALTVAALEWFRE